MSLRLSKPFRAAVASARAGLGDFPRERLLFDVASSAGELAYRLPDDDINLRHVSGAKDPRRRLLREHLPAWRRCAGSASTWARAGSRLSRYLEKALEARGDLDYQSLRVLLQYAPTGLAPDGVVPEDPMLRTVWRALARMFASMYPTKVKALGTPACLDARRFRTLRREAASGLPIGRVASGRRPGAEGRRLAVDPALTAEVSKAVGRPLRPGLVAKYLYYTRPRDHIWPHADDPNFSVNLLICIERVLPPGSSSGSALLTYRPDGTVRRHEIAPGCAVAMESGVVHARESLRPGERVVLLSILYR